jgi:S-(hydroxymethyl)glutathione dehydrogenase/alcohol dehydrogenase
MKTTAAISWGLGQKWEIEEVELDGPKAGEVLVQLAASGLCHSDHHLITGDIPIPFPIVGGHEGAGTVLEVGPGVTEVEEGDSVVLTFLPSCGRCTYCARGWTNLCDLGAASFLGPQLDGSYRFHARGEGIGQMCLLGTFSEFTVVPTASIVKVDKGTSLDMVSLIGCGVTTGWGSVVNTGEVKAGDSVVVVGVGGLGQNAVQAARFAGARYVVAVDPVEFKRDMALKLGATHSAPSMDEAWNLVSQLTRGHLADCVVLTTDHAESEYIGQGLQLLGKRGKLVVTAVPRPDDTTIDASLFDLVFYEKQIRGAVYGSSSAQLDVSRLVELYRLGDLKLDELVTREYKLEDVNQGYEDLLNGENIRGLIRF